MEEDNDLHPQTMKKEQLYGLRKVMDPHLPNKAYLNSGANNYLDDGRSVGADSLMQESALILDDDKSDNTVGIENDSKIN